MSEADQISSTAEFQVEGEPARILAMIKGYFDSEEWPYRETDTGGRYAVEAVSTGTFGGKLDNNLVDALNEGDTNGRHPAHFHGLGAANMWIIWDKQGR